MPAPPCILYVLHGLLQILFYTQLLRMLFAVAVIGLRVSSHTVGLASSFIAMSSAPCSSCTRNYQENEMCIVRPTDGSCPLHYRCHPCQKMKSKARRLKEKGHDVSALAIMTNQERQSFVDKCADLCPADLVKMLTFESEPFYS